MFESYTFENAQKTFLILSVQLNLYALDIAQPSLQKHHLGIMAALSHLLLTRNHFY